MHFTTENGILDAHGRFNYTASTSAAHTQKYWTPLGRIKGRIALSEVWVCGIESRHALTLFGCRHILFFQNVPVRPPPELGAVQFPWYFSSVHGIHCTEHTTIVIYTQKLLKQMKMCQALFILASASLKFCMKQPYSDVATATTIAMALGSWYMPRSTSTPDCTSSIAATAATA